MGSFYSLYCLGSGHGVYGAGSGLLGPGASQSYAFVAGYHCPQFVGCPGLRRAGRCSGVDVVCAVWNYRPWLGRYGDDGGLSLCWDARVGAAYPVLAVPVCGLGEYVLLGTALSVVQITWMVLLLAGVALVVAPGARFPELHGLRRWPGLMYGALSGISMGVATLISRYAYHLQDSKGGELDGIHAAWQRMLGGLSCMLLLQLIGCLIPARSPAALAGDAMLETDSPSSSPASGEPLPAQGNAWPWMIGSTLLGPIIGIGAYQWALVSVEGAVVQAISSLVPVVVIPVAWVAEGDRPGWRGVVGGVVACGAAVALALS